MAYLTIFTAPKPFTNPQIDIIQRNAIRCWKNLDDVEVILIGNEDGMAEISAELGVRHLPDVAHSEWGTPLVSSMFHLAREAVDSPLLMCANADMLFLPDLVTSSRTVASQQDAFLVIGQRWDLDVTHIIDFNEGWDKHLRRRVYAHGKLHLPAGSDFFIFKRTMFLDMPDFAIGRSGWDNWMIYHTLKQGLHTIDATQSITAIHQNHDYSHLPGGMPHHNHEESHRNIMLAGGAQNLFTVLDTDRQLRDGQILLPKMTLLRLLRTAERRCMPFEDNSEQKHDRKVIVKKWLARRFRRLRRRIMGSL